MVLTKKIKLQQCHLSIDCRIIDKAFANIVFMKIAKKKVTFRTPLVSTLINLESPVEIVLEKGKYIAIKCNGTLVIWTLDHMRRKI